MVQNAGWFQFGWVKINSDGARKGRTQVASVGGLIRDGYRNWIARFISNLGCCLVLAA